MVRSLFLIPRPHLSACQDFVLSLPFGICFFKIHRIHPAVSFTGCFPRRAGFQIRIVLILKVPLEYLFISILLFACFHISDFSVSHTSVSNTGTIVLRMVGPITLHLFSYLAVVFLKSWIEGDESIKNQRKM